MAETASFEDITQLLDGYVDRVNLAVALRNGPLIPVDTYQPQVPSVLAGLLARQATLATRLAQSPPFWDGHVAPLILRPMVECLVSFRWMVLEPVNRTNEYVIYALGQAKLTLSKIQAEIERTSDEETKERLLQAARLQEAWVLSQRLMQYVDVNLGSWTGSSIRKMCEEVGDKDLYDFWFAPHSACAHNTWQHVSVWNTKVCRNPLHQEHRLSHTAMPNLTLEYVHQAAKFFSALIEAFDAYYEVELGDDCSLSYFEEGLVAL